MGRNTISKITFYVRKAENGQKVEWESIKMEFPSVGGEHIGLNGRMKITKDNLKFVPTEFYKKSPQGKLENLDILICKDGALTGKVAIFLSNEIEHKFSMVNEHVFLLRVNKLCDQNYLYIILFSTQGQQILKSNITGQAQGGLK